MINEAITTYLARQGYDGIHLKATLFDMDGVLFDSMKFHARAWQEAMSRYGMTMSREEAYRYEGRTGASTIDIISRRERGHGTTPEEAQQIYHTKSEIFNSLGEAERMPGAYEVLTQIKADGLTPVVVTGSGQLSLIDKLNHFFPGIFRKELMVTAFDVKYGKPNPEPYLMGLQKASVKPNEAIVVENAPLGVKAGVDAGIFTIAVNTGPLPDEALLEQGANLLLHSMQELSERWEEIRRAFLTVHA